MKYDEIRSKALEVKQMNIRNVQINQCTFASELIKTIDTNIATCDAMIERYKLKKVANAHTIGAYVNNLKIIVEKFHITENK